MTRRKVALIPGDGIGPEVAAACRQVLTAARCPVDWVECQAGADSISEHGDPLPRATVEAIKRCGIGLKGPVTTPIGSGFHSVNVRLRRELDLFACVRPARALPGVHCRAPELDTVIIRENTEGLYSGIEQMVGEDRAEATRVITARASRRIARFALMYAKTHGHRLVTAVHKGNILKLTDGLFLDCFQQEAALVPGISTSDMIVDNACMQLALSPSSFDVVVTTNLFGDILSDLAAGLTGGPGLAAGANLGDETAVFEPVHGSAPDIAGTDTANPTAMILSATMMLDHLGLDTHAHQIRSAVHRVFAAGRIRTRDLGGTATTSDFAVAVCRELGGA